ncbi:low-density lipoprotein receptor class A domain-containing protein 3 isoform X3 [Anolis carolinensis]|uniref:low-density lipoprotein receptor class A domain-containing protein 3 isoform X3 n=1 Tax=Anolis carolinensis TaxID=28377 RepID=UPI002F2B5752
MPQWPEFLARPRVRSFQAVRPPGQSRAPLGRARRGLRGATRARRRPGAEGGGERVRLSAGLGGSFPWPAPASSSPPPLAPQPGPGPGSGRGGGGGGAGGAGESPPSSEGPCGGSSGCSWARRSANCCLGITLQMNAIFLETSCVVMDVVSQVHGSVMGYQTALTKVTRRNAQKPNRNVAPPSFPVQVEFTVSLAASDAMVLRTVQMAVMKKTVQQIPCCALLTGFTVGMACALIRALCVTIKTTAGTTVMKKVVETLKVFPFYGFEIFGYGYSKMLTATRIM